MKLKLHWLHFLSLESSKNLGGFTSKGSMYEWTKNFVFVQVEVQE